MPEEKKKKLAMVVFSGDMDKLFAAFSIATGAAASNMDVTMFFTFWGLRALKKKKRSGKSFLGRLFGLFYGGDISRSSPSKMSLFNIREGAPGSSCRFDPSIVPTPT